eukprot:gene6683-13538_t
MVDYSHYIDYLPHKQEGYLFTNVEDFRTVNLPPSQLRNRKIEIGALNQLKVEDVLKNTVWPSKWPYSFEDFRPGDYSRDRPFNTGLDYAYIN